LSEPLLAELKRLYAREEERTRAEWNRSLPSFEAVSDRWERAAAQGWGRGTSLYHLSYVYGDVRVGENTWIGPYTLLDGSGGLAIGDWCSISSGVHIYTHNTVRWAISGGTAEYEYGATSIGDCCFVGPMSVVSMGVTIASRCVVAAHSVVNGDLPEASISAGAPARVIGRVKIGDRGDVEFVYD
jgi:acetyltransferase-like isoleucine patch superfamily enzyme